MMGLGSVFSTGRIDVESADPLQCPFVNGGMLSDKRDMARVRQGVRHLFELVQKAPMKEVIDGEAKLAPRGADGRPVGSFTGDDDLEQAILAQCSQYFHPVGTCRMGSPEDPLAVVDPQCRVLDTDGLFVADASLMPGDRALQHERHHHHDRGAGRGYPAGLVGSTGAGRSSRRPPG